LAVLAAALAASAQQSSSGGLAEGKVVSSDGVPIPGATLEFRLLPAKGEDSGGQLAPVAVTIRSGPSGEFAANGLQPGRYSLTAKHAGFVNSLWGPSSRPSGGVLNIGAETRVTGLIIVQKRAGQISGTVVDPEGEPVPDTIVVLLRHGWLPGGRQLIMAGMQNVRADGTFQFTGLQPARYFIRAVPDMMALLNPASVPVRGYTGHPDNPTWYPSGRDRNEASPVEVSEGFQQSGIKIVIRRGPLFSISGKLIDIATGRPFLEAVTLEILRPGEARDISLMMLHPTAKPNSDGSFAFHHVPAGEWIVQPRWQTSYSGGNATSSHLAGRVPVTLSDRSVNDVQLYVGNGVSVEGLVKSSTQRSPDLEPATGPAQTGPPQVPPGSRLEVSLTGSDDLFARSLHAPVRPDGSFVLNGIPSGAFSIHLAGLEDGLFVTRITTEGLEQTSTGISIRAKGRLTFEVADGAASISGTVRSANGDPLPDIPVSLWPDGTLPPAFAVGSAVVAYSGADGGFRFQNLQPGKWRLSAWEGIEPFAAADAALCRLFSASAISLELTPRQQGRADLTPVSPQAITAAIARMP
jgi:protocatechuate 3,4-dioxygenase beta subunit